MRLKGRDGVAPKGKKRLGKVWTGTIQSVTAIPIAGMSSAKAANISENKIEGRMSW